MIVEPHHQGHHRGLVTSTGCDDVIKEGNTQLDSSTFLHHHHHSDSDVTMWPQGSEPPSYNEHISWNALSSCRIDYFNNKFGRSELSSSTARGGVKAPTPVKTYVGGGGEMWKNDSASVAVDETDSSNSNNKLRGKKNISLVWS